MGAELTCRPDRCTGCGDCVPLCPSGALTLSDGLVSVAWDRCRLQGACEDACLPGALEVTGQPRTADGILDMVERDRIYYDQSGGGVTLSGGEPFAQPGFLRALLLGCRERELPVVLDTCGHVAPETFQELAPLAAGLLFDLKVLDEERHEAFSGVHNRWILENLKWAARKGAAGKPVLTVRLPLIPGVNDDPENLEATAAFLSGLEGPPPVDVLPYHRLGVDKYRRLGREYPLARTGPPGRDAIGRTVRVLASAGLTVTVRGERHGDD